jgi:sugar lactone lactonase YvrE
MAAGILQLLVVNHGGREAIEFFEVRTGGAKPTIHWNGCVPITGDVYLNSVVALGDGGFIASHFYSPGKGGINPVFARQVTGGLLEWHPGGAVTLIPGTELSGANGIAASGNDRVLHVAAWGTRELVRFERHGDTVTKRVVPLNFAADNLRWSQDGRSILAAGQKFVAREGGPAGLDGWTVVRVNPDTLATTVLFDTDAKAPLQGVSSAVEVDDQIWVGTFRGDRIGYFPKPR